MSAAMTGIIQSQFEAALAMLRDCVEKCPPAQWDGLIAKYPFWHAAYHTLCFVDCYLSASEHAFQPRATEPDRLHPLGIKELEEEYPSRRFEQSELRRYVAICLDKLRETLAGETEQTLAGPSGFSWLPFSRAELHLYNIRHVQHHAGQLGAHLRRAGVELAWVKAGWPR